jgi:hypothetical protein
VKDRERVFDCSSVAGRTHHPDQEAAMRHKRMNTRVYIDRNYPYQVEFSVPQRGFRKQLDAIMLFCVDCDYRTRSSRRWPSNFVRWCFIKRSDALLLQEGLGGLFIDLIEANAVVPGACSAGAAHEQGR